jgi:deoxyhypusine synthase
MTPGPVEDVRLTDTREAAALVDAFDDAGGFVAAKVSSAANTLGRMLSAESTVVLSFPAAPVATGMRGLLVDLVQEGHVDAIVTTCGTLDHDIARTKATYRQGSFALDDVEVAEHGYHRLGSVLVPEEAYGPLVEDTVRPLLGEISGEGKITGRQLCEEIGRLLRDEAEAEGSLLATCANEDVPVFVPGLTDGAVGSQVWSWWEQDRGFSLDLLRDEHEISNLVEDAAELDALMIGGGISKHHTIWWAQFADGLDRAVYITTASEHDGSLSGARMREAISWNKLKAEADHVTVTGEATAILPLVLGAALERSGA